MSTCKHQDGDDTRRGPEEPGGEDGREVLVAEEGDGADEGDDHGCDDVGDWVEGFVDVVGVRSERGDPVVEVAQFEPAVEAGLADVSTM